MLEEKVRNQKRQLPVFNTMAKPGLDDEESYGSEKKDGNRKHYAFTYQGKYKRSKKACHETS